MSPRITTHLSILVLVAAVLGTWSNSYQAPLAFDDFGSIRDNPSIQAPYSLNGLLHPPSDGGQTVSGRPLLNLSFAFNHWISGKDYTSYRVTNILIHIANALLVFGIAKLTLKAWQHAKLRSISEHFPFALALVWALHPLTTSAVSYLVQRAESLSALCLLLTLFAYAASRGSTRRPYAWLSLSLLSCYAGINVKETMAAAPFIVLLYAWIFSTGEKSSQGHKPRIAYFTLLFASLIPLILLSASTGDRASTASLTIGLESLDYLKTQSWAIIRYLTLAIWPQGLVFDYGRDLELPVTTIWLPLGAIVVSLLLACCYLCIKKSPIGFLGLSLFTLLAPTSSIFPLADPIFEHRFYLPITCFLAIALAIPAIHLKRYFLPTSLALAVGLALATFERNEDYKNPRTLWESSLAFSDLNARAHTNLGAILIAEGETTSAVTHLRRAVDINPTPLRYHNLGNALALQGRPAEAIPHYQKTLQAEPNYPPSLLAIAQAYKATDENLLAIQAFRSFLELRPDNLTALRGLASALAANNEQSPAIEIYRQISELAPKNPSAFFDLGDALARSQDLAGAKAAFLKTTELAPSHARAYSNLGNIHLMEKDFASAITAYEHSIALEPSAIAHTNLAISLLYSKRIYEAKTHLQKAIALDPNYPPAQNLIKRLR